MSALCHTKAISDSLVTIFSWPILLQLPPTLHYSPQGGNTAQSNDTSHPHPTLSNAAIVCHSVLLQRTVLLLWLYNPIWLMYLAFLICMSNRIHVRFPYSPHTSYNLETRSPIWMKICVPPPGSSLKELESFFSLFPLLPAAKRVTQSHSQPRT